MTAIIGRRVRTTQPQHNHRIDRNNPISVGLVFAYVCGNEAIGYGEDGRSLIPYVKNTDSSIVYGKRINTPSGTAGQVLNNTEPYLFTPNQTSVTSGTYSLFAFGTGPASGIQSAIDDDDGTTRRFQFRLNAGKAEFIPFYSGGNGSVAAPSALSATDLSTGFAIGATVNGTAYSVYQKGVKTSATLSGTALAPNSSINIGARKNFSQQWLSGGLMLVAMWNRPLADWEMESLAANPWQLFMPAMRRLWMPSPPVATTTELVPGAAALSITGHAPTIDQTANITLSPAPAALSVTGYAPTIEQTANTILIPAPAALAITGYAPVIEQTKHLELTPGMAVLAITGYAPTVEQAPIPPDPRYARPLFDVSAGSWTPSSGDYLAAMLSEADPDISTSIHTSVPGSCEIRLAPVVDPQSSSGQVVRYQAQSSDGGGLTVRLKQGSTVIAEWTHDALPSAPTVFTQALTTSQCDAITDYGDLRFEFEAL